jgi:DNA helicase-2/ATP-dependent DNA helicase PcrA
MPDPGEKKRGETPGELVDLLAFATAFDAYRQIAGEAPQKAVATRGKQVATQMRAALEASLYAHVASLVERPDAAVLRVAWMKARRSGSPDDSVARVGEFTVALMTWMRSHPQVLRDIFATGRAFTGARRLMQAALSGAPQSVLSNLATCPPVSRLRIPFRWITMAAAAAGLAPLPEQQDVVEGEAVAPLVDEIRTVQSKILATEPDSEDAADLQESKAVLEHQLQVAVETSPRPEAASRAATASITARPDLEIEKRYRVDEEQARIVLATGKLVVSAGAGSGKTTTVVAKVEHAVRDQGYDPEQILVTSFTNKAANELKERLEARGIHGVRTGTTHNVAKEIIVNGRPDLREQLSRGTQNADTLFRLAIIQVGLSPGGARYAAEHRAAWGGRGGGRGQWKGRGGSSSGSPYWKEPVGEWFNLGLRPEDTKGRPLGSRRLRTLVGLWQNSMIPTEKVWDEWRNKRNDDPLRFFGAAVYGAYQWLKKNDPRYGPAIDLDEWIPTAVRVLQENPAYRDTVQRRFKIVGVDEAQDQNSAQHLLFAILGEKADTYMMIGDDFQCVEENTPIDTPNGHVLAKDLREGDEVLSYVNGEIGVRRVVKAWRTAWTHGIRIATSSGRQITVSPNHKLWTSHINELNEEEALVYLMWRRNFGFRVGVTDQGWERPNPYGGHPMQEGADKLWILDRCDSRNEALLKEESYSLEFGIPTVVFNGTSRGMGQDRIDKIFEKFGRNGALLLEARCLSFDLPHWVSSSYDKHGVTRRTIRLNGHASPASQVTLEWSGRELDDVLGKAGFVRQDDGRNRLRKYLKSYAEAENFARDLQALVPDSFLDCQLSTPDGMYRLTTASGVFPGMKIPVMDSEGFAAPWQPLYGVLDTEEIVSVETVGGSFIDIEVEDSENFFGGGILSHNSIYAFRGAVPQEFIQLPQRGFDLLKITTNYRSGKAIVDAGNRLIAHNENRQIPKVCKADVERRGMGEIRAVATATHEAAATYAADEIASSLEGGNMSPDAFGILVRNNAEADAYALALMVRGIPFRCKRDFFSAPAIKSVLAWMTIAVGSPDEAVNDAVTRAHMVPGFFLDKEFASGLAHECPKGKNYLQFLLDGGLPYTGRNSWRNAKMVRPYVDALREMSTAQGDAESLIRTILDIRSDKGKFIDALEDEVDPDDLLDESSGVDITEEQIREAALAPLQPLFQMSSTFQDPAKFMEFIGKMERANARTRKGEDAPEEPAVLIGTVHSWKGLERSHTYVSMAGGVFPHMSNDERAMAGDVEAYDEERRLAYVALTRGRDSVTVLSPQTNYLGKEIGTSRFIDEACIGWQGETPAAPADGTDENALRREAGEHSTFACDFGADLVACMHDVGDDDSWSTVHDDPDDLEDEDIEIVVMPAVSEDE